MQKEFRDFQVLLGKNGYTLERVKGSHFVYVNTDGNTISVNKDLNKMVAKRLIRENNLKGEDDEKVRVQQ